MRINFRQGVVGHQAGGFLSVNGSGNIDLLANNKPVTVTVAHKNTNYIFIEYNSVVDAWVGPFAPSSNYWLYWEFNPLTFQRTFNSTALEPIAQSAVPGNGNTGIIAATPGTNGFGAFIVQKHYLLPTSKTFAIIGSTANDGTYTVLSTDYDAEFGQTTIYVNETVVSDIGDGAATLDVDLDGNPLETEGRLWYNTETNIQYIRVGSTWVEIIAVFAGVFIGGSTFVSASINGGTTFTGTQIGSTNEVVAGRVLFDESGDPILHANHTFFTTEDQFYTSAARVDGIRLESNVAHAQYVGASSVAQYTVVAYTGSGQVDTAQYPDVGQTVVGMIVESVSSSEVGAVILQGVITNPSWNWTNIGAPLWVNNGSLVGVDPHYSDPVTYASGRVPVARVLDTDTIIFEQGLGGKGDTGPAGSLINLPSASTTSLGAVTLLTPSSDAEIAYVISDTDSRLTNARTPTAHTHVASDVSFTPGGGVVASELQSAVVELGSGKVNKAGDTMTGALTLSGDPTVNLHAATKKYVDDRVNGFIWLQPVCITNIISDIVTAPPLTPNNGDAYIVPVGATGDWSAITTGNVVQYVDGTGWVDRGAVTDINPIGARFGVAMTSSTTPSGSFAGQKNNIALFDNTGTLTGFEVPVEHNAVYVCNTISLNAFKQFAFDGTSWLNVGGGTITADGVTTTLVGNELKVLQYADGGVNDVSHWQGLVPTDLDPLYVSTGGDTMTGLLTLSGDPTLALHAATKQYVDTQTANTVKTNVAAVTTVGYGQTSVALTDGANIAVDLNLSDYFDLALAGDAHQLDFPTLIAGQTRGSFTVYVTVDAASTGWAITLGAGYVLQNGTLTSWAANEVYEMQFSIRSPTAIDVDVRKVA